MKIKDANFSVRVLDILNNHTYSTYITIYDISNKTQGEFMRDMKTGGIKTLKEISIILSYHNLRFKGEDTFGLY